MLTTHQFAEQVPYLRRFARALSGSQASGDAYVTAVLEALVADPTLCRVCGETEVGRERVLIYRLFLALWSSLDLDGGACDAADSVEDAARRNLDAMTPKARQAFLLRSMEGFQPEDIATILGTDTIGVARLIDQAGREIARQISTDVLIIEDEPLIALDLATIVQSLGHHVVARARTLREALRCARATTPGLILADIHLADGSSGIDAVNAIISAASVPVVFITAYPERLLTGERPEPTFLINKPYEIENVTAVISQALFFQARALRKVPERAASPR